MFYMDNEQTYSELSKERWQENRKNIALDFLNVNCEPNVLLDKEEAQNNRLVRFDFVNFVQFHDHFLQLIHSTQLDMFITHKQNVKKRKFLAC